jgi:peptidoglycan hydrolase-like protein with peptidoglycan-binding domain
MQNLLKRGDKGYTIIELQQALGGLTADGDFGGLTEKRIKEIQAEKKLEITGVANREFLNMYNIYLPSSLYLTNSDYEKAAILLKCEVAAIKAVVEVESSGNGFLDNGDVKILFEPHIFWAQLQAVNINPNNYTKNNTDILYPRWTSGKYGKVSAQWGRMNRAISIARVPALKSASYGKFQVMGFNHKTCGYPNVTMFVEDMSKAEYYHLIAFVNFCLNTKTKGKSLAHWLQVKNWDNFAYGYNGSGYAENNYHTKMKNAYIKYSK